MMGRSETAVGVIGGGIGGLAAGLSLLRAGLDVHVYEQAAVPREVGAGIQVSPNASRVLHRLGLAEELARMGVRPVAFHQRRWDDGRTLLRTPLGDTVVEVFGFPHYQMHRADVLFALAGAFPAERLHLGYRLVALADRNDRVEATFENGRTAEFDVLVGADGIHSTVRSILFGPERPRFTGCAAYRGLVPSERLADLELELTAQIWRRGLDQLPHATRGQIDSGIAAALRDRAQAPGISSAEPVRGQQDALASPGRTCPV